MLRLLTPDVVAQAAQTQIKTGERVCLNWDIENLNPPGRVDAPPSKKDGNIEAYPYSVQDSAADPSNTVSNGLPRA